MWVKISDNIPYVQVKISDIIHYAQVKISKKRAFPPQVGELFFFLLLFYQCGGQQHKCPEGQHEET